MKEKICVTKSVLVMLAIAVVFAGTTGCAKSAYYIKQIDDFADKGYPKAERISGKLVSDIKHEVVDGTAIIEDTTRFTTTSDPGKNDYNNKHHQNILNQAYLFFIHLPKPH